MRIFRSIATALVCGALLTACSSADEKPKRPAAVKAGQCLAKDVADGNDRAPDYTSVVKCSEPHVYEVLQVTPIPKKYLSGTTKKQKLANRAELVTIGEKASKTAMTLRQAVYPKCFPEVLRQAGLSDITYDGKSAKQIGLTTADSGGSTWFNLTSPKQWLDGQTNVVCMIRFGALSTAKSAKKSAEKAMPVSSPDEGFLYAHYTDSTFPVEARRCIEATGNKYAKCTGLHDDELLFRIDLRAILGTSFAKGANLARLPQPDFERINATCKAVYKKLGYSTPRGRVFNYRFPDGVESTKTLPLTCVLQGADGPTREYLAFTK